MIAKQETWPRSADLEQAVKLQIMERTGGRIQALEVEVAGDRIGIHGRATSYYVKQLALEGTLDVLGATHGMRIELDVQVAVKTPL